MYRLCWNLCHCVSPCVYCMHMCRCRCLCMFIIHIRSAEMDVEGISLSILLYLIFDTAIISEVGTHWLAKLANSPQKDYGLIIPDREYKYIIQCMGFFMWLMEIWIQVLVFVSQVLYPLRYQYKKLYFKDSYPYLLIIKQIIQLEMCLSNFSHNICTLYVNNFPYLLWSTVKKKSHILQFYLLTIENKLTLCKVSSSKVTCDALIESFILLLKLGDFKDSLGFAVLDFPWHRTSIQPPPTNIRDWTKQVHFIRIDDGCHYTAG